MKSINERDLDEFLGKEEESNDKKIKQDKSLIERIDKKIITEDGRQLLM
jgi:hypothetical protein